MQTTAQDIFLFLCFFGFSLSVLLIELNIFSGFVTCKFLPCYFYLLIRTYPKLIRINQNLPDYFSQFLIFSII